MVISSVAIGWVFGIASQAIDLDFEVITYLEMYCLDFIVREALGMFILSVNSEVFGSGLVVLDAKYQAIEDQQ